jgi:hypothetical protein
MLTHRRSISRLYTLEEIRMVTYLSQLHQKIQIIFLLILRSISILKKILIYLQLHLSQPHINMYLFFRRKILLYLSLSPSQHKRLKYLMKLSYHLNISSLSLLLSLPRNSCSHKPIIK